MQYVCIYYTKHIQSILSPRVSRTTNYYEKAIEPIWLCSIIILTIQDIFVLKMRLIIVIYNIQYANLTYPKKSTIFKILTNIQEKWYYISPLLNKFESRYLSGSLVVSERFLFTNEERECPISEKWLSWTLVFVSSSVIRYHFFLLCILLFSFNLSLSVFLFPGHDDRESLFVLWIFFEAVLNFLACLLPLLFRDYYKHSIGVLFDLHEFFSAYLQSLLFMNMALFF